MNDRLRGLSSSELNELAMDAWTAIRTDELFDPKNLAQSLSDFGDGCERPLADLLAALMQKHEGTAADNMILRYNAAMDVVDLLVDEAMKGEIRAEEHQKYIDDMRSQYGR